MVPGMGVHTACQPCAGGPAGRPKACALGLFVLLTGLVAAVQAQPPPPTPPPQVRPDCRIALPENGVQHLFAQLVEIDRDVPCELEGIRTERFWSLIRWTRDGQSIDPAVAADTECMQETTFEGQQFSLFVPASLARKCPDAVERMAALTDGGLGPAVNEGEFDARAWDSGRAPANGDTTLVAVSLLLFAAGLLLGARVAWRSRRRWPSARRWWLSVAALTAAAIAVRLVVHPGLANWYSEVLVAGGPLHGRFGPGYVALQLCARTLLPWTDTTPVVINTILGGIAVPIVIALLRERGVRWSTALVAGSFTMLEPLLVRLSAAPGEHVLSSTMILLALLAWSRGVGRRDREALGLGLVCMAIAALTRADTWPVLATVPIFGAWRDRDENPAAAGSPMRARLTVPLYYVAWLAVGALVYFAVVVPSRHPMPELAGVEHVLDELLTQHLRVALTPPHWISPVVAVLAIVGVPWMLLRRRRLLGCVLVFIALSFLPLGRDLMRDELLGGRYFGAVVAMYTVLAAHGAEAIARAGGWLFAQARAAPVRERGPGGLWTAYVAMTAMIATFLLAIPAYRQEFTFQAEYDFLRTSLAELPDGCTVVMPLLRDSRFQRDLDCCLDVPRSPLVIAYPRLRFHHLLPDQIDLQSDTEGCVAFYESAACSLRPTEFALGDHTVALEVLPDQCARILTEQSLTAVGEDIITPHVPNDLFDHQPIHVGLWKKTPSPSNRPRSGAQ